MTAWRYLSRPELKQSKWMWIGFSRPLMLLEIRLIPRFTIAAINLEES